MPATKTRRRRTVKTNTNERHQIIGPDGAVIRDVPYNEGHTVSLAQMIALEYEKPTELRIRLVAQYGEPDDVFRVVRDEHGTVSTWRV